MGILPGTSITALRLILPSTPFLPHSPASPSQCGLTMGVEARTVLLLSQQQNANMRIFLFLCNSVHTVLPLHVVLFLQHRKYISGFRKKTLKQSSSSTGRVRAGLRVGFWVILPYFWMGHGMVGLALKDLFSADISDSFQNFFLSLPIIEEIEDEDSCD